MTMVNLLTYALFKSDFHSISKGSVVCLEKTLYCDIEDVGVVQVCAVVCNPTVDCPLTFPFTVGLSTTGMAVFAVAFHTPPVVI